MAEVTITPTSVTEYKNGNVQTAETIRLGYQSGSFSGFHDIAIELDLPKSLKSLTVYQDWRSRSATNAFPTYAAWVTKEALTAPPEDGAVDAAVLTFKFSSGNDATVTINKRLSKGKWYLWFGRPRNNGEAASFLSGDRGTHPILTITGETGGGTVKVLVDGEVKETVPKAYKDGVWKDPIPKFYKNGTWEEMS